MGTQRLHLDYKWCKIGVSTTHAYRDPGKRRSSYRPGRTNGSGASKRSWTRALASGRRVRPPHREEGRVARGYTLRRIPDRDRAVRRRRIGLRPREWNAPEGKRDLMPADRRATLRSTPRRGRAVARMLRSTAAHGRRPDSPCAQECATKRHTGDQPPAARYRQKLRIACASVSCTSNTVYSFVICSRSFTR